MANIVKIINDDALEIVILDSYLNVINILLRIFN